MPLSDESNSIETNELFKNLSLALKSIKNFNNDNNVDTTTEFTNKLAELALLEFKLNSRFARSDLWKAAYSNSRIESAVPFSEESLAESICKWIKVGPLKGSVEDFKEALKGLTDSVLIESNIVKQVLATAFVRTLHKLSETASQPLTYNERMDALVKSWYLFSKCSLFDSSAAVDLSTDHQNMDRFGLWVCFLPKKLLSLMDETYLDLRSKFTTFEILTFSAAALSFLGGAATAVMAGLLLSHTVDGLMNPVIGATVFLVLAAVASIVFARYSCVRDAKRMLPKDVIENIKGCPNSLFQNAENTPLDRNQVGGLFGLVPEQLKSP